MKETINLGDFLREIGPDEIWFIKTDIREIVDSYDYIKPYIPDNYDELTDEEIKKLNIPSKKDLNIYKLPSYEEINHYEVMRFFVKECVDDKNIRRELFDALRYNIYMERFVDVLKKYDLYKEYLGSTDWYYDDIIKRWMEKYNITFD